MFDWWSWLGWPICSIMEVNASQDGKSGVQRSESLRNENWCSFDDLPHRNVIYVCHIWSISIMVFLQYWFLPIHTVDVFGWAGSHRCTAAFKSSSHAHHFPVKAFYESFIKYFKDYSYITIWLLSNYVMVLHLLPKISAGTVMHLYFDTLPLEAAFNSSAIWATLAHLLDWTTETSLCASASHGHSSPLLLDTDKLTTTDCGHPTRAATM